MSDKRKLKSFKRLKGIVVLSLFDGMSCGQIALDKLNVNIDAYYASEVDKYAIQVTKHNYQNTIHIGSVVDITIKRIDKFTILLNDTYIIDTRKLIVIGGSPCQGFSFAGKMLGSVTECNIEVTSLEQYIDLKNKDFQFKGQSYLFWEYVRILNEVQPQYYLLENVKMVKKWEKMFNDTMGREPIMINSALVSAQTRKRLYWTNIPNIAQPIDRDLYIKDILEDEVDDKYYMSNKSLRGFKRHKRRHKVRGNGFGFRPIENMNTKSYTLTDSGKNRATDTYIKTIRLGDIGSNAQAHRVYSTNGKSVCLSTASGGQGSATGLYLIPKYYKIRKLTPKECERLQTVPDDYTSSVSDSQRYKMLGNGWTVEVIKHIFSSLFTI